MSKQYENTEDNDSNKKSAIKDLLKNPKQLKMLILSGTDLNSCQLDILNACQNLIKLDISSNKITEFPTEFLVYKLKNLKLLYVHNNQINTIKTID